MNKLKNIKNDNSSKEKSNLSILTEQDKYVYYIYMIILGVIGSIYFYFQIDENNILQCKNKIFCIIEQWKYLWIPYFFIAGLIMLMAIGIYTKLDYMKHTSMLVIKILLVNLFASSLIIFIAYIPLLKNIMTYFPLNTAGYIILGLSSKFVIFFAFFYLIWGMSFLLLPSKYFGFVKNRYKLHGLILAIFIAFYSILSFSCKNILLFVMLIITMPIYVHYKNTLQIFPKKLLILITYLSLFWPVIYFYQSKSNKLMTW